MDDLLNRHDLTDEERERLVRLAAAYFGPEPPGYVRRLPEAELARLADANAFLKAAFNTQEIDAWQDHRARRLGSAA